MRRSSHLSILIASLSLVPALAQGQASLEQAPVLVGTAAPRYHTHAYMSGQLMGVGAVAQTAAPDESFLSRFGGGIGLTGGVRLNRHLSIEGNWTFALHDEALKGEAVADGEFNDLYLMTFTADLKAHLPTASAMEPYLQVGGGLLMTGGIYLDERNPDLPDVFAFGATLTAGCGLDIWVTRHITMGARVLYRGFALGEPVDERKDERAFRNYVHAISVDAYAGIHF